MKKKALVVENDPTILEFIEVMFETEGLEVISVREPRSALELGRRHRPHVIVSDLYMAGLTGLDLFEQLRNDPATGDIPFVFITADAREAVRQQCLALGADAFLLKPFTFDQFMETVRPLLNEPG